MSTPTKVPYQQRGRGWMKYPTQGGLLRLLYKSPLLYWRLGMGPLLRRMRMLVITTRGRKSGKPRHTMLEHTFFNGRVYLAPGWGERTQWYLNLLADPHVTVQRGAPAESCIARRVSDDKELAALYQTMHGKSPVWKQYLDSWGVQDTTEDFLAKKERLVMLRLEPCDDPPLPGLRCDLVWVWLLVPAVGAVYLLLR